MNHAGNLIKKTLISRIDKDICQQVEDILLREDRWQLLCNNELLSIHNCLSLGLEQMAVGQMFYKKRIRSVEEIAAIHIDEERRQIRVDLMRNSTVDAQKQKLDAEAAFSAADIHRLQKEFNENCGLFRLTGSAHSCALADKNGILLYFEDVARHNAMDKVLGEIMMKNIDANDKALFFSGRLALDLLEKAAITGVKVLASPGAPTLTAVEAAKEQGITLLGFVRAGNINIYTNPQRIHIK